MTDLRELAERWRPYCAETEAMADELLSILDAEGDGEANTYCERSDCPCHMDITDCRHKKTRGIPARSGVVSDEDCREFLRKMPLSAAHTPIEMVRAALEHFAKGERHER